MTNLVYDVKRASCSLRPFVPQILFPLAFSCQNPELEELHLPACCFLYLADFSPSFLRTLNVIICSHFHQSSRAFSSKMGEMWICLGSEQDPGERGKLKIQERTSRRGDKRWWGPRNRSTGWVRRDRNKMGGYADKSKAGREDISRS